MKKKNAITMWYKHTILSLIYHYHRLFIIIIIIIITIIVIIIIIIIIIYYYYYYIILLFLYCGFSGLKCLDCLVNYPWEQATKSS